MWYVHKLQTPYYIFCYLCKLDYKKNMFLYTPTLNWHKVKQVFVVAKIIKKCEWAS